MDLVTIVFSVFQDKILYLLRVLSTFNSVFGKVQSSANLTLNKQLKLKVPFDSSSFKKKKWLCTRREAFNWSRTSVETMVTAATAPIPMAINGTAPMELIWGKVVAKFQTGKKMVAVNANIKKEKVEREMASKHTK